MQNAHHAAVDPHGKMIEDMMTLLGVPGGGEGGYLASGEQVDAIGMGTLRVIVLRGTKI